MKISYYYIVLMIFFAAAISCNQNNSNRSSNNIIVEHPIEESIPYYDQNHIEISRNHTIEGLDEFPEIVGKLQHFLESPKDYEVTELNLPVSGTRSTDLASISDERVVVLDKSRDQLIHLDLPTHETLKMASQGRGPGDIAYAMEMTKKGKKIFIAMEDMRISRFDCQVTPCEFEEIIPLDFSPISLALTDKHYLIFGQTPFLGEDEYTFDEHAIRVLDQNGDIQFSFGKTYDTDHWIVLFTMRDGIVRNSPVNQVYLQAIKLLPYIYVYDHDFEIRDTYLITDFIQGKVHYNSVMRAASPPSTDFSLIENLSIVDDDLVLVTTNTTFDKNNSTNDHGDSYRQDYYVIDLSRKRGYHLGNIYSNFPKTIHVTENGLFLNSEGLLHQIQ